jgi:hypothetical protein
MMIEGVINNNANMEIKFVEDKIYSSMLKEMGTTRRGRIERTHRLQFKAPDKINWENTKQKQQENRAAKNSAQVYKTSKRLRSPHTGTEKAVISIDI